MPDRRTRRSPEILNRKICINYIITHKFPVDDADYVLDNLIADCNKYPSDANGNISSPEAQEFCKTLNKMSDDEVLTLYRSIKDNQDVERKAKNSEREIFLFLINQPQWRILSTGSI